MSPIADIMLEKPGIIAISEALRQQLGLVPGMSLVVEAANGGTRLRIKKRPAYLQYEDQVLVFTGEQTDTEADSVQTDREQRMLALMQ